jgi:hypothetical protein
LLLGKILTSETYFYTAGESSHHGDSGKFRNVVFSDVSLLSSIDDISLQNSHFRSGSVRSSREFDRSTDGPPKSEAELMGIFLRSPKKSDGRNASTSGKSPFSLEEEDIERVLGLIESLEARNTFLSQNLQFRDAEYKETRTRLEELEDVLTVANEKENTYGDCEAKTSGNVSSFNDQLKAREIELEAAYWRLSEMQRDFDEKLRQNKVIPLFFNVQ